MSRRFAFYAAIQNVPEGRVATYGRIARAAGFPRCARQVGQALAALPRETSVPWHRVVNARGEISTRAGGTSQRRLLEAEGVEFDARGRIDLGVFTWREDEV
ncbi:MAG: methylated-DNA--[protein]-cysteine S-methyltransferase [Planctomycetes bacterium]|nr:methylated-DNA--[protein]-cysteine S-methyltransferase [Planctomycetota bacterium]